MINTRAILLFETDKKNVHYLRVSDWWLQVATLEGPWTYAKQLFPDDMKTAEEYVVSKTGGQTLQTASSPTSSAQSSGKGIHAPGLFSGKKPAARRRFRAVYVAFGLNRTARAREETRFSSRLPGTVLEYAVENSNGDFFRLNGQCYVLIFRPLVQRLRRGTAHGSLVTAKADMPPDFREDSGQQSQGHGVGFCSRHASSTRRVNRQLDPADRHHNSARKRS